MTQQEKVDAFGREYDHAEKLADMIARAHGRLKPMHIDGERPRTGEAREAALKALRAALDAVQWYEGAVLSEYQSAGGR